MSVHVSAHMSAHMSMLISMRCPCTCPIHTLMRCGARRGAWRPLRPQRQQTKIKKITNAGFTPHHRGCGCGCGGGCSGGGWRVALASESVSISPRSTRISSVYVASLSFAARTCRHARACHACAVCSHTPKHASMCACVCGCSGLRTSSCNVP